MPRLGQMKFTHHLGRPFHAFAVLVADAHDLLCKTAAHEGLDGLHKEILSLMKEAKVPKEACPSSPQTARRILASVDPELNDKLDPILSVRRGPNARALAIAALTGDPTPKPSPKGSAKSLDEYVESIAADVAELREKISFLAAHR